MGTAHSVGAILYIVSLTPLSSLMLISVPLLMRYSTISRHSPFSAATCRGVIWWRERHYKWGHKSTNRLLSHIYGACQKGLNFWWQVLVGVFWFRAWRVIKVQTSKQMNNSYSTIVIYSSPSGSAATTSMTYGYYHSKSDYITQPTWSWLIVYVLFSCKWIITI